MCRCPGGGSGWETIPQDRRDERLMNFNLRRKYGRSGPIIPVLPPASSFRWSATPKFPHRIQSTFLFATTLYCPTTVALATSVMAGTPLHQVLRTGPFRQHAAGTGRMFVEGRRPVARALCRSHAIAVREIDNYSPERDPVVYARFSPGPCQ
jgi:hypothetical protein